EHREEGGSAPAPQALMAGPEVSHGGYTEQQHGDGRTLDVPLPEQEAEQEAAQRAADIGVSQAARRIRLAEAGAGHDRRSELEDVVERQRVEHVAEREQQGDLAQLRLRQDVGDLRLRAFQLELRKRIDRRLA